MIHFHNQDFLGICQFKINSHIGAWPPGHARPQISSSSETFRNQWKNVLTSIDRNTPLWNRAWLLACDIGPELDRFGPELDNVELECCCTHSLEFTGNNISDTSYQSLFRDDDNESVKLVYVPTLAIPSFVEKILPLVPQSRKFVLVTGLSDWGPCKSLGKGNVVHGIQLFFDLVSDNRIIAYFGEAIDVDIEFLDSLSRSSSSLNLSSSTLSFSSEDIIVKLRMKFEQVRSKIKALPLGIDLHTLAFKQQVRPYWGPIMTPINQVIRLEQAVKKATHEDKRIWICWGVLNRKRKAITDTVTLSFPEKFIIEEIQTGGLISRDEFWAKMGRYKSIVSVEGYSLDTHRTWEGLILGCNVIVQDTPLTRLLLTGGHISNITVVNDSIYGSKAWQCAKFENEESIYADDQIKSSLQRILGVHFEETLDSKTEITVTDIFGQIGQSLIQEDNLQDTIHQNFLTSNSRSIFNPLFLSITWMKSIRLSSLQNKS